MRFDAPGALWGLLVLPLIVLLYMLRARRQDVPVSTILLWQRARTDLASQRPIRRLERSILLLAQLLGAALIVLALARPQVRLPWSGAEPVVIVLDTSASMQATDVRPSRFAAAVRAAQDAAQAAQGPVMVITAGARPRSAVPFSEPGVAHRALAGLHPTDGPGRLDQAITLALGQRTGGTRPRVEVFTDRAGGAIPGVRYHMVGAGSRNVGISGVHTVPEGEGTVLVIQVHNAGTGPERVPVTVSRDGAVAARREVRVAAGAVASLTVRVTGSGVARVRLDVEDLLAVDNTAYAVVGAPPPRVIVAGSLDRVLAEALTAIPVRATASSRVSPELLAVADVIVLNRTPPVELPPGNYLLIGTTAPNLPLGVDGTVRGPQVLRWSRRHPVMRYVDLGGITIGEALRLIPRGGDVLAEGETPLLWAYEGDGLRAVVLAFPLEQSDLPLRVAFPILLSNTLSWLGGTERQYAAGETITIPAGAAPAADVVGPDGSAERIPASGGRIVLPAVERTGIYTVRVGARVLSVAVNPSPEEAVITPLGPPQPRALSSGASGGRGSTAWRGVLLAVLLVLIVEWLLWLRTLPRIPRPARAHLWPRRAGG